MDDIVLGTHSSAGTFLQVTNGADTVIGGDVTLSLSAYVEMIHDQMVGAASSSAIPSNSRFRLNGSKDGSGNVALVASAASREVYTIAPEAGTTIIDLTTPTYVNSDATGGATDKNLHVKVFVNGQLMRESKHHASATVAGNNSTTANPVVDVTLGDYVIFRNGNASDTNVYDNDKDGGNIKFGFTLEKGDIVQVMIRS